MARDFARSSLSLRTVVAVETLRAELLSGTEPLKWGGSVEDPRDSRVASEAPDVDLGPDSLAFDSPARCGGRTLTLDV